MTSIIWCLVNDFNAQQQQQQPFVPHHDDNSTTTTETTTTTTMELTASPTDELNVQFWEKTVSDVLSDEEEKKKRNAKTASDEKTVITDDDESNKSDDTDERTADKLMSVQQAKPSNNVTTTHHRVVTTTNTTNDQETSTNKQQGKRATGGTKMWNAKSPALFGQNTRNTLVGFDSLAKMKPVPGDFSGGSKGFDAVSLGPSGFASSVFGLPGFGSAGFASTGFASSFASTGFTSSGFGSSGFGASANKGFSSEPGTSTPPFASLGTTAFGAAREFGFGTAQEAVMMGNEGTAPVQQQSKKKRKKVAPAFESPSVYAHGLERVSADTMSVADMQVEMYHRHQTLKGCSKRSKKWFLEQLGVGSLREKIYGGPTRDLPRVDHSCTNRALTQELRFRRPGFKLTESGKDWLLKQLVVGTVLLTSPLLEQRSMQRTTAKKQRISPTSVVTGTEAQEGGFTGYSSDQSDYPGLAPVVPDGVPSSAPVFQPEAARRNKRKRSTNSTGQATRRMKPKRQRQQVGPTPYGPQDGAPTEYNGVPVGEIRKDIHGEEYCYI